MPRPGPGAEDGASVDGPQERDGGPLVGGTEERPEPLCSLCLVAWPLIPRKLLRGKDLGGTIAPIELLQCASILQLLTLLRSHRLHPCRLPFLEPVHGMAGVQPAVRKRARRNAKGGGR